MPAKPKLFRALAALAWLLATDFAPAAGDAVIDLAGPDVDRDLSGRDLVFLARDLATGQESAIQPDRVDDRHSPFSTFKIPNLIIALETGVAPGLDQQRAWVSDRRPSFDFWPEDWKQDQTLASAFRRSAVWYFRDIAVEVGGPGYRSWLDRFSYGNQRAPDDNDIFWLGGPLAISPREQVDFLDGLLTGRFDVQQTTLEALREVSLLRERSGHRLHGKTGAGRRQGGGVDEAFQGWLVGWIERPEQLPVVFALYVGGPDFQSIAQFRLQMSTRLLQRMGALPPD
ncbi:MAG: penicillin-binding transpeptidase domain-containing protein [Wenzhouxiangella sp.]|jgi:beta-lactamase class D|nr:penicillin-binding transpeptidase domain-containing protein [Wenzhouxiangella sp.]